MMVEYLTTPQLFGFLQLHPLVLILFCLESAHYYSYRISVIVHFTLLQCMDHFV
jgi:hypothetical protein